MGLIYDLNRAKMVNVYGPPGTAASVQGLLQFLTVSSEIRISDGTNSIPIANLFRGHDTGVGVIFQDANVKVTAAENSHLHFPPRKPSLRKIQVVSLSI
jgi:hypothetical protein